MNRNSATGRTLARLCCALALAHLAIPAFAASARVYVSAKGSDSNTGLNCALATPCRSFAAAVTVVSSGGDVVALDTAGFGPVTITQSLTLTGPAGTYAGITAANPGNGVTINAPGANVRIRGIVLESQQPATTTSCTTCYPPDGIAIDILAAANVSVENCVIAGFPNSGILTLPPGSTQTTPLTLNVLDSVFVEDGYYGALLLWPAHFAAGATVSANIRNVSLNGYAAYTGTGYQGIFVGDGATAAIDGSQIVGYLYGINVGALAGGTAQLAAVNNVLNNGLNNVAVGNYSPSGGSVSADLGNNVLIGTSAANTAAAGANPPPAAAVYAYGAGQTMTLNANTISGNAVGVYVGATGQVKSYGNNQLSSNGTDVTGSLTPDGGK